MSANVKIMSPAIADRDLVVGFSIRLLGFKVLKWALRWLKAYNFAGTQRKEIGVWRSIDRACPHIANSREALRRKSVDQSKRTLFLKWYHVKLVLFFSRPLVERRVQPDATITSIAFQQMSP